MNRVRPEIWRSSKRGTLVRGSLLTSFFMRELQHIGQFNDHPKGGGVLQLKHDIFYLQLNSKALTGF